MKILAIEDNPADFEILREVLSNAPGPSFEIENARTLSSAAALLAPGNFDLVLLDLGLPDSLGIDTLRAVRAISKETAIVVLTGFDDEETGLLALHEGAQDYLVKGSINENTLARAIRYAVERNSSEQELVRKNLELNTLNQALRESEERFRTLADFTNDWEEWVAPDRSYVYISPSCERISGYSAAEFVDDPTLFSRIIHPGDRPAWDGHLREAISDRKRFEDVDFRIGARNGNIRWISHYCQPVISKQGEFYGTRSSNRDITEKKNAEKTLLEAYDQLEARVMDRTADLHRAIEDIRKERHRLYEVLETLPVYVCLLTAEYHMPFANQYFRETFGESHGKRCYEFLFNRTEPCETCESFTALKTRAPHHWYWTGPDARDYDVYDFPFTDSDGSRMILEMGIDITERRRAEAALRQHQSHLEEVVEDRTKALAEYAANLKRSNEDLERFAYVASHDLREPLRMVTAFSQLLEKNYKGRLDTDADEFIRYIVEGGRKMDALVNDLLEYSRIASRGKPFEPTDMNAVLDEAQKNLSMAIEENKARIEIGILPTVSVDRSQMTLVFQNLLSNAIKFHDRNPPVVSADATRQEDEWEFSVRDNGIGIAPEYHGKIFELFQRLHSRDDYHGTGIGLAICKRVVERHGGRIWVESEPGKGSTFFFTLPDRGV